MKVIIEPRLLHRGAKAFKIAEKEKGFSFLPCLDTSFSIQEIETSIIKLCYQYTETKSQAIKNAGKNRLAIVLGSTKFSESFFRALAELSRENSILIHRFGSGYDTIPVDFCRKYAIKLSITAGASSQSVAELCISLLLALSKNLVENQEKAKKAVPIIPNGVSKEVSGKNLAVIGFGNIGEKVAYIAHHGFAMKIYAYTRGGGLSLENGEKKRDSLGLRYAGNDLEYILKQADFVSLNLPLNTETQSFIAGKELALMKKNSILINTSRASVLNEQDCIEALVKGETISALAVDTFTEKLLQLYKNELLPRNLGHKLLFSPHQASHTVEANAAMTKQTIINLEHFQEGHFHSKHFIA